MVFVNTDLETALERNAARKERKLFDFIVKKGWHQVQEAMKQYKTMFRGNFIEIKNPNLPQEKLPREAYSAIRKFVNRPVKNPIAKKWIKQHTLMKKY